MNTALFTATPIVTVRDNRGLAIRAVAYCRHPDTLDVTDRRITHHGYDARGRLVHSADPRLSGAGQTNVLYRTDLTGTVLHAQRADTGVTLSLNDAASRPIIALNNLPATDVGAADQGMTRTWQYEAADLLGRVLCVTEQVSSHAARIAERFVYAGSTAAERARNLAGQCVSHFDTAGLVQVDSIGLTGAPHAVTRRLLQGAAEPFQVTDWQGSSRAAWDALLDSEPYTTLTTVDATGTALTTTDAQGHRQCMSYNVVGQMASSWVTLTDSSELVIVKSLNWSAAGQKLQEEHGNGVVTLFTYEAQTQRLVGIKTQRPNGHAAGARTLQDLRYAYDPVGNVLKVSNDAEETRFWRNQKVVPENTYAYDSLYQLTSASGREMTNTGRQSTNLPRAAVPLLTAPDAYTLYTRTYRYDAAGNLTQIRHSAPATSNHYTTDITLSNTSNRGVLSTLTAKPEEVEALFTAGGQQTQLQPGQGLAWTSRNELLQVTPVVRDGAQDDREGYRYDATSQRVLKVRQQHASGNLHSQRTLYLPGLELHRVATGQTTVEALQVITVGAAGRAQVRLLHWTHGQPAGIANDQLRFTYDTLTGSTGLEVDGDGNVISMEEYYPYGGTAVFSSRSAVEANYKTIRHSGKELDATGLYYYGYRYYQPWIGRWLSADPAGTADGLNMFRMSHNNPCSGRDSDGRMWDYAEDARLQPLADRLQAHDLNVFLGILGLASEHSPAPRHLAAYILSGLNNDFPAALKARKHLKYLEGLEHLDFRRELQLQQTPTLDPLAGIEPMQDYPIDERYFATAVSSTTTNMPSAPQPRPSSPTIEYLSPDSSPDVKNRIDTLSRRVTSHLFGSLIISGVDGGHFQNTFTPDEWRFQSNFKNNKNASYFASDVVAIQYAKVSQAQGYALKAPKQIIRESVVNPTTLTVMNAAADSALSMKDLFLTSTPNGRSTQRIMDYFGLEATNVTRINDDFIVDVRVKPSPSRRALH